MGAHEIRPSSQRLATRGQCDWEEELGELRFDRHDGYGGYE